MSYVDSAVAGFFGVAGVVAGVLLERQIRVGERKELKVDRTVLLAIRVQGQVGGLLTHLGMNEGKLTPLLAENLEGKSPSKTDFERMITEALSAYPLPIPPEIEFPTDDPTGYPLVAMAAQTIEYAREANAAAEELKAGKMDAEHVSNFIVLNDRAVTKDTILGTAKAEYSAYLDALEEISRKKFKPEDKDAMVKKLVSDSERSYLIGVEMGRSMDGYRKIAGDYLRHVGW